MRIGLWLLMALFPAVALAAEAAQWHRVESPHFVFYSDQDPDEAREKIYQMELFRELALMVTGIQPTEGGARLEVYLASSLSQYQDLADTDSAMYASRYVASWGGDRAAVVRDFGEERFNRNVLLSAYVTELMTGNSRALYPSWYMRGFSEYLSQVKIASQRIEYGMAAQERLDELRRQNMDPRWAWEPYAMLMNRSSRPESWIGTYDAQSWLATHFFMSDEKRKRVLLDYLEEYNKHGDSSAAYKATIGKRYTNFDQEIIRYFAKGRYVSGVLNIKQKIEYPIQVVALEEADVLLMKGKIHVLVENPGKCENAFARRLSMLPDDAESRAGLALCKAYAKDFSALDGITLPDEASEVARLWLASAYMAFANNLGKEGKDNTLAANAAYEQVTAVLKDNKRSAKAIAIAAWVMSERGNHEMAAKLYQTAAVYAPYDLRLLFGEARALAALGDMDAARLAFDRLMVYHGDNELSDEGKALKARLYPESAAQ